MSEGYIEASVEDPKSGAKISVIQNSRKPTRIVQFDNWVEQEACSDFLAGIIVRGIRSLEEERAGTLARGVSQGPLPEDWQDDDMGGRCGYGDD